MAIIARDGRLTAVRLNRGAVLLDARRGCIVELEEAAATALDFIFFEGQARPLETDEEAKRVGRMLRGLRQELFEVGSGPVPKMDRGQTALRRHADPVAWSRPPPFAKRAEDVASLTLGLVRRSAGVLALSGERSVVASVTNAFPADGTRAEEVSVLATENVFVQTAAGELLHPLELWTVELGGREGLTLARLSPARALVELLGATRARPSTTELSALALCAERIRHFSVVLPRDAEALARVVTEYVRAAIP